MGLYRSSSLGRCFYLATILCFGPMILLTDPPLLEAPNIPVARPLKHATFNTCEFFNVWLKYFIPREKQSCSRKQVWWISIYSYVSLVLTHDMISTFVRGIHRWPICSPSKRLLMNFCCFYDVNLHKRMNKQLRCRCFKTPWRPNNHCNVY